VKQIYLGFFLGKRNSRFMEYVHDVIEHPQKRIIAKRLEIIKFYDDFGEQRPKGRSVPAGLLPTFGSKNLKMQAVKHLAWLPEIGFRKTSDVV
jgi:hypothetical protein